MLIRFGFHKASQIESRLPSDAAFSFFAEQARPDIILLTERKQVQFPSALLASFTFVVSLIIVAKPECQFC